MGVLDMNFDDGANGNQQGGARRRNDDPDWKPAMIWANVGYTAVDPETGEETFIGLPMGIPVDNMRPARGKGWMAQRKNALQKKLLQMASGMEPGDEGVIGGLKVQLRRTSAADPNAEAEAAADMPEFELIR